jgi:hypothetical protein
VKTGEQKPMGVAHRQLSLVERSALAEQVNGSRLPLDPSTAGLRIRQKARVTYINESQNVRSSCISEAGFSMEKTWSIG